MPAEVMTLQELADYLHCHRSTIYRMIKRGQVPFAFKIGSDYRFLTSEVNKWLLANSTVTHPSRQ